SNCHGRNFQVKGKFGAENRGQTLISLKQLRLTQHFSRGKLGSDPDFLPRISNDHLLEIQYTLPPMKKTPAILLLILVVIVSLAAQNPQPAGEERLGWAFPVIAKVQPPRQEGERQVPGS